MLDFARTAPIDATYLRHVVERLAVDRLEPARIPRHRHAGGSRRRRLRGRRRCATSASRRSRSSRCRSTAGACSTRASPSPAAPSTRCASMGGAPPTGPGGVLAPLVDVGTGERRRLDRLDVAGRIALLDWRSAAQLAERRSALELGLRGAVGHHPQLPRGRARSTSRSARSARSRRTGTTGAPPFVTMCKEDAAELRAAHAAAPLRGAPDAATPTSRSTRRAATSSATCPASAAGAPIVVGAHHDGWFSAAFDNATGVAAMLALARALAARVTGRATRICFTSRTAEEYGLTDSAYGWCTGAWGQICETHPTWGAGVAVPPQPRGQRPPGAAPADGGAARADALGAPARAHGRGRGLADERLVHARPAGHGHRGLAVPDLGRPERVRLHVGAGVHAHRLPHAVRHGRDRRLRAPRAALPLLRLPAPERRRRPRRASSTTPRGRASSPRVAGARRARRRALARPPRRARRRARARARSRPIGRGLYGVDAHGTTTYPHTQAARDVERLEAALAALAPRRSRAPPSGSSRAWATTRIARTLSRGGVRDPARARGSARHPRASWGAHSHPTDEPGPVARARVAARRARARARRAPGSSARCERHLERSRAELARRLAAMERALAASRAARRGQDAPSVRRSRCAARRSRAARAIGAEERDVVRRRARERELGRGSARSGSRT